MKRKLCKWCPSPPSGNTGALFLDSGADVDKSMANGATPVLLASRLGLLDIVKALLAKGADANAAFMEEKVGPLHGASIAAGRDTNRVMEALLDAGAYVEARDASGRSPLMWTAAYGNFDNLVTFLMRGADPAARDNMGRTAKGNVCDCVGEDPILFDLLDLVQVSHCKDICDDLEKANMRFENLLKDYTRREL